MRIYLDNCCFNRPFDSQAQVRIQLETEAKLHIQERVVAGEIELAWAECDYFVTTDDTLLKKLARYNRIAAVDPTAFVRSTEP